VRRDENLETGRFCRLEDALHVLDSMVFLKTFVDQGPPESGLRDPAQLEVLTMADQCRLEGQRGANNSTAAIEATSTIVRIAYLFEIIARERIAGSPVLLLNLG
jgi:hypothetical protein